MHLNSYVTNTSMRSLQVTHTLCKLSIAISLLCALGARVQAATSPPAARPPATAGSEAPSTTLLRGKPVLSSLHGATASAVPLVAIDTGRNPMVSAKAKAVGKAEFDLNQRLAEALERALLARKVAVKRIPSSLTPTQRAQAAAGTVLLVSVNHEVLSAAQRQRAMGSAGYSIAVSDRPAVTFPAALECAKQVAVALQTSGRSQAIWATDGEALFASQQALPAKPAPSAALAPGIETKPSGLTEHWQQRPWLNRILGVQQHSNLPVLNRSPVPALRLQAAVLTNPTDARLARDATWVEGQARAMAKGIAGCLPSLENQSIAAG
jgi:N-acetylmuramoyl-L-alanine amidase